ncbi:MAG: STAS domain-containing protein [Edaphobacter sp.]
MSLKAVYQPIDLTTAVFHLTGRMAFGTSLHEIEAQISGLIDHGVHKLVLDLSGVEYLDSAGLGVLLLLYGNMKTRGGHLRLVAPNPKVLDVLKMTRTDSILSIAPSIEAAIAS